MRRAISVTMCATLAAFVAVIATPSRAQLLTGNPAMPEYKYSTPPGVVAPDKLETRFGTLNFFNGFPDKVSAEKLFDNLDFQRAVQAYLLALPVVSQAGNRNGILEPVD